LQCVTVRALVDQYYLDNSKSIYTQIHVHEYIHCQRAKRVAMIVTIPRLPRSFFLALLLILHRAYAPYPSSTLQCFSDLTKPDYELICPPARHQWCVKEVSNVDQTLCGSTQYFGDRFVDGDCRFKYCAAECEEGTFTFIYDGETYTRTRYCCEQNMCNSAPKSLQLSIVISMLTVLVSLYLCLP
jgi:hypothetical protein